MHPQNETQDVGKGEINHPTTWDEYPNGRFGDPKSPAYGGVDLWGGTLATSVSGEVWTMHRHN
jgi:methylenetetrahydrofolate reductase (NADPH)